MERYVIEEKTLTAIADSIRNGKGTEGLVKAADFASEISVLSNTHKGLLDRSITKINIPYGIKTIGYGAFYYCDKLDSVTIPNSVTMIEGRAFRSAGLRNGLKIPSSVTVIEGEAFHSTLCRAYDFSEHTEIPFIGKDVFSGIPKSSKIIVPEELFLSWKKATNWVSWEEYITTPKNGFEVLYGYIANEGMTWREWVNSEYSRGKFHIDDVNSVWETDMSSQITIYDTDSDMWVCIHADDQIIRGEKYLAT